MDTIGNLVAKASSVVDAHLLLGDMANVSHVAISLEELRIIQCAISAAGAVAHESGLVGRLFPDNNFLVKCTPGCTVWRTYQTFDDDGKPIIGVKPEVVKGWDTVRVHTNAGVFEWESIDRFVFFDANRAAAVANEANKIMRSYHPGDKFYIVATKEELCGFDSEDIVDDGLVRMHGPYLFSAVTEHGIEVACEIEGLKKDKLRWPALISLAGKIFSDEAEADTVLMERSGNWPY